MAKLTLAGMVICLVLNSCAFKNGQELTDLQVNQFKIGQSTKSDVETSLGSPTNISQNSDGTTSLIYQWGTNTASAQNYIPLVGPFISKSDYRGATVTYVFGSDGILESFKKDFQNTAIGPKP